MPELPEVETMVRYLRPKLRGKRIVSIASRTPQLFRDHTNPAEVRRALIGETVTDVRRSGKYVVFRLSNGRHLAIHPMMTGKFLLDPKGIRPYDRMTIAFRGRTRLVFNDVRKFGRVRLIASGRVVAGEDPLSLPFAEFRKILRLRRGIIKTLLLNQGVFAGIGNIYSDEILWQAGIHPRRKVAALSDAEFHGLWRSCRRVLALAIEKEGASMRDYRKPDGNSGGYYKIRKVYGRAGERCVRDGARIFRIKVGSRSAHFCPLHQR